MSFINNNDMETIKEIDEDSGEYSTIPQRLASTSLINNQ